VKTGRDRIEKDPDQQVQGALRIVFAKFAELQSVRQVHVWLREEGIALPTACHSTPEGRSVVWRLPLYNTVHNILTNPVYAGAYAFGRTMSKVSIEEGRKRVRRGVRRPLAEWDVLLKDQHEGYISWVEFERNQQVIANNATGKGSAAARGAVRRGELLLAGLLRCGHCGRKMYVAYGGKAGRYLCEGALVNHGTERCISFGGMRVHDAVSTEVLRVLKPLGIEAAIKALDAQAGKTSAAKRQLELALQRARFEATHARRQYDAVDPHCAAPRRGAGMTKPISAAAHAAIETAMARLLAKIVTGQRSQSPALHRKSDSRCDALQGAGAARQISCRAGTTQW